MVLFAETLIVILFDAYTPDLTALSFAIIMSLNWKNNFAFPKNIAHPH